MMVNMSKITKKMIKHLNAQLGEQNASLLLAFICDSLNDFSKGVDYREIRSIEFSLNNFDCYRLRVTETRPVFEKRNSKGEYEKL